MRRGALVKSFRGIARRAGFLDRESAVGSQLLVITLRLKIDGAFPELSS